MPNRPTLKVIMIWVSLYEELKTVKISPRVALISSGLIANWYLSCFPMALKIVCHLMAHNWQKW